MAVLTLLVLVSPSVAANPVDAATKAVDVPFSAPITVSPNEKMLVESDQLVYDYDRNTVAAVGNVKIYFAGYTLEAEKVSYNKGNGRLIATGSVKLVDPSGSAFYSEYIDITDDFREGFVQSLRVDTIDHAHFAAERAERSGGDTTTFVNGTYTACEPCAEHPEKPVLWSVKAEKIVVNQQEHMVYFTNASLEFFGLPIAYLPYFGAPDATVKRKSGFLTPIVGYSARVGAFGALPYFHVISPDKDATITPTVFSKQGLLLDGEYRQRTANGQYSVDVAGIYQLDPNSFVIGSPANRTVRGGVRTTGEFAVNNDWTLGWDGTLSTDRSFTRDYGVLNQDTAITTSTVHLTGIHDRNYLEARSSYFQVLTDPASAPSIDTGLYNQGRQGVVAPVVDYQRVAANDVLGGEVSYISNIANVVREENDPFFVDGVVDPYFHGTAGDVVRITKELDWQRRIVGPGGQLFTPFASVRGDAFFMNGVTASPLTTSTSAFRFMPTVGAEWSLPILATVGGSTHIIEPMVQVIARPDEMDAGVLPNNDAQSLVFDVSNLFDRDKFSGFDRVEGGTRANLGVNYTGTFTNGAQVQGTFGQSILLAGTNSFAVDPGSNVGAYSGLETSMSDYVAGVSVDTGTGPRVAARGRFDEKSFNVNRAELQATTAFGPITASASYLYLRSNQNVGVTSAASVIRGAASVNMSETWRAFGTVTYDFAKEAVAGDSIGVAFDNECLTLSLAYSETYASDQPSRWLNLRIALRTFGDAAVSGNLSKLQN
ncbi:MAG: LPS-assembly protein LptD [Bauldia sp.]